MENHEMLVHHEGVLCRHWEDPCPGKPSILQVVVPRHLRSLVLQEYHDQGGHTGSTRLQKKLTQQFHWVGMKKDVLDWVASCSSCSQLKRPVGRGSGAPIQSSWTGYPFERVAMDLIPNLPETAEGNRHILVVVDYFTKWVEAFPLPRMDASAIALGFVNEFVSRFGAPDRLHTDQGKNFDGSLFRSVCFLLGIDKTRTTAYHPQSDGLVERFNQTLERGLAHYVCRNHRDWDIKLPAFLMGYRSTPQTSTGYSPSYLLFGRELCLPQDLAFGLPPGAASAVASQPEFASALRRRLEDAHAQVREHLGNVHRYQAHIRDRNAKAMTFAAGDAVWLLVPAIPTGTTAKFSRLWHGPYLVEEKLSAVTYRIKLSEPTARRLIVHVNRLKSCHHRSSRLQEVHEQDESDPPQPMASTLTPSYQPDATDAAARDEEDTARVFDSAPPVGVMERRTPRSRHPPQLFGSPVWHE